VTDILTTIADVITLFLFVVALYGFAQYRRRIKIVVLQDLDKPLAHDLKYEEISSAVNRLVEDARSWGPDCIIGVNRGGAIVGGLVAKHFSGLIVSVIDVDISSPTNPRFTVHRAQGSPLPNRILLVDDAYHTGFHMKAAYDHLKTLYPLADFRRVVLMQVEGSRPTPHPTTMANADFRACWTHRSNAKLPWDY
jgi:hypoxanthine phosphoribosyltransferase